MMTPLESPNLPDSPVGLTVISIRYPLIARKLHEMGIHTLLTNPSPNLISAVCDHADMLIHDLGNGHILLEQNQFQLYAHFYQRGLRPAYIKETLQPKYPKDIRLNAARIGENLFGTGEWVSKNLLEAAKEQRLFFRDVKQGYTKCSVCIVDRESIITADDSILRAAKNAGFQVLKICPGFIQIPQYAYGFIGGCAGKLSSDILAFTGALKTHPDGDRMRTFIENRNIKICELSQGPLVDIGGILPILQQGSQ